MNNHLFKLDSYSEKIITQFLNEGFVAKRVSALSSDGTAINPSEWDEEKLIKGMDSKATIFIKSFEKDNKTVLLLQNDGERKNIRIEFAMPLELISLNGEERKEIIKEGMLEFGPNGVAILISH